MVTQQQFIKHYNDLYDNKAIYVWGANSEIITKDLTDKLYKTYGSKTYNKTYYDNKYKEGYGKIGADCSGSIYPLSKKDNTAKGYYNACSKKGSIDNMPSNIACLVFNSSFSHVGAYLGNGQTIEMKSSKENCVKQNFQKSRWAYYGIPNWLDTSVSVSTPTVVTPKDAIIANVQKWCNSFCKAGLVVDGEFGPKTKAGLCKALQHYLNIKYNAGLTLTGSFDSTTKKKCKVAKGNKELTYICQAMLYVKGYNVSHSISNNNFDGKYGSGMAKTVLEYQQNTKGLLHDGKCGPATFYAMFNS